MKTAVRFSAEKAVQGAPEQTEAKKTGQAPRKFKGLKWLGALGAGLLALLPLGCGPSAGQPAKPQQPASSTARQYDHSDSDTGEIGITPSGHIGIKTGGGFGIDLSTGQFGLVF